MIPQIATLLALAATIAATPQVQARTIAGTTSRHCGTKSNADIVQLNKGAAQAEAAAASAGIVEPAASQILYINTYFHVVSVDGSAKNGSVPKAMLDKQLKVMNTAYLPHNIQFKLLNTTRTIKKSWSNDEAERDMKKSLRRGDYKTLNLYFQKKLQDDALGYCYYPFGPPKPGSVDFLYDGCSIQSDTVPGGSMKGYDMGLTAVHEIGHWFGLLHTFEGDSCAASNVGDLIADTPQQLSATSGCPKTRDSCPKAAGLDPIHNYMDYSTDICYDNFTKGQRTRMITMYNKYRKNS